jgi:hypothetical protein
MAKKLCHLFQQKKTLYWDLFHFLLLLPSGEILTQKKRENDANVRKLEKKEKRTPH